MHVLLLGQKLKISLKELNLNIYYKNVIRMSLKLYCLLQTMSVMMNDPNARYQLLGYLHAKIQACYHHVSNQRQRQNKLIWKQVEK